MRDCPNAEMRDALPDLMHGTLPSRRLAEVRAHVDRCAACREELELLTRVRDAVPAPAVDVGRIVAGLPRYRPRPAWGALVSGKGMRVAAAIVLVAGGVALLSRMGAPDARDVARVDSASRAPMELALGETFVGVSDTALVSLVEVLDDLEPVLSEEPESVSLLLLPTEGS